MKEPDTQEIQEEDVTNGQRSRKSEDYGASQESQEAVDNSYGLLKAQMAIITAGLCLAVFLISLDRTIIAVTIPDITNQFHSFEDVGWYGSAYLITTCAVQPLFGQLFTTCDTKWTYIATFGLFEVGSLVCATAPNSTALIIGRAFAGCGAGGVLSGSYVVVAHTVPLRNRPLYIASVSVMFSIGAIVAPLIGGALTQGATWRWVFYLNLPVGLPVMSAMILWLRVPGPGDGCTSTSRSPIGLVQALDLPGAVLLLGAAVMLFYALQQAAAGLAWKSSLIIGLLIGAGVTALVFAVWQALQGENGLLSPRILRQRTILASSISNIGMYAALVTYTYFLPTYFQAIRNAGIVRSAVDILPLVISCSVFSILTGIGVTKTGYFTPPAIFGLSITLIGAGLMTTVGEGTPIANWAGYQVLLGTGLGLALQAGFFGVQAVLPQSDVAAGSSLMTFCQSLGGALGVSIGDTVLNDVLRRSSARLMDQGVNIDQVIQAGATAFQSVTFGAAREALVEEYARALRQVFVMAAAFSGMALVGACFMEFRKIGTSALSQAEHEEPEP